MVKSYLSMTGIMSIPKLQNLMMITFLQIIFFKMPTENGVFISYSHFVLISSTILIDAIL